MPCHAVVVFTSGCNIFIKIHSRTLCIAYDSIAVSITCVAVFFIILSTNFFRRFMMAITAFTLSLTFRFLKGVKKFKAALRPDCARKIHIF